MTKGLQRLAQNLLTIVRPPVPVEKISQSLRISIVYDPFEGKPDLSGMLVRDGAGALMVVNANHPRTRQRFTVAHEIGHFLLDNFKPVWVDRKVGPTQQVSFRASDSPAYAWEEVRANKFAATLLMPPEWVRRDFEELDAQGADWENEDSVQQLAQMYEVSYQATLIRLVELGLLARPRQSVEGGNT